MELNQQATKKFEVTCKHSWHSWYASSFQKMRECYGCGVIQAYYGNKWLEVHGA